MTNSINSNSNNCFDEFYKNFSIPPVIYYNIKSAQNIAASTGKEQKDIVDLSATDKPKKPLGKIVAYSMVTIGAVVLLFTKGISSSTANKLKKWFNKVEIKKLINLQNNKTVQAVNETIEATANKVRKIFKFSNALANLTAIKDTAFHEITSWNFLKIFFRNKRLANKWPKVHNFLNKWLPLQKVCDWFTNNVFKLTRGSVDNAYRRVGNSLDSLEAYFRRLLNNPGITPTQKARIEQKIQQINPLFKTGFDQSARDVRFSILEEGLENLDKQVKNKIASPIKSIFKGIFFKKYRPQLKDAWQQLKSNFSSYITESAAAPSKAKLGNSLNSLKVKLSYNIEDVCEKVLNEATELKNIIKPKDVESKKMLAGLFSALDDYAKKLSGSSEAAERVKKHISIEKLLNDIRQRVINLKDAKGKPFYTAEEITKLSQNISNINEIFSTSSEKGLLQKILSDFKDIYGSSSKEYIRLKACVDKTNKALNSAIELEGTNMFGKYSETRVGSIPTDMLGLAVMAGGGAHAITKGKDKEEKVGATLKVAVPLLGAIGMYFYTGAKAISGVKNLALTGVVGFILNRIGSSAYKYYQKRIVENKSVQEIANEAINEATSV